MRRTRGVHYQSAGSRRREPKGEYAVGDHVVTLYFAKLGDYTLLGDGTRVPQRRNYVPTGTAGHVEEAAGRRVLVRTDWGDLLWQDQDSLERYEARANPYVATVSSSASAEGRTAKTAVAAAMRELQANPARPTEIWYRAGNVERGPNYQWREGYARLRSEDVGWVVELPWLTKKEAQSAAKSRGAKAVFFDEEWEAKWAIQLQQMGRSSNPTPTTFRYFQRAGRSGGFYHHVSGFDGYAVTSHDGPRWTAVLTTREGGNYGGWVGRGDREERALADLGRQLDEWRAEHERSSNSNPYSRFSNPWGNNGQS